MGCASRGVADPLRKFSDVNAVALTGLRSRTLQLAAVCTILVGPPEANCPPGPGGWISLNASKLDLDDLTLPQIDSEPIGTLVDGSPLEGVRTATFRAKDGGGGIQKVKTLVDGREFQIDRMDSVLATCREPYTAVVPCPNDRVISISVDTRAIANGAHWLELVKSRFVV